MDLQLNKGEKMEHCPGCNCKRSCKCGRYKVQESSGYPGFWYSTDGVGWERWENGENHSPTLCTRMVEVEIDPLKDHGYTRPFLNPVTNQWEPEPTDL
jgi:hypothetical protein